MSRDLVRESFRYENGQVARRQPVTVVVRGTDTLAPLYEAETGPGQVANPTTTDSLGTVAFYAETGFYDFIMLGARVPFDIEPDSGGGSGGEAYVYTFTNQGTWSMPNPFGRPPIVQLYDMAGHPQDRDYEATDATVAVSWPYPVSGKAVLK